MHSRTRGWLTGGVLLGALMAMFAVALRSQSQSTAPVTPAAFLAPGLILQDHNGDGVTDFVDAHLIVGDRPGPAEVAAAADLAARLGFETSAMDLPVPLGPGGAGTAVIVGAAGLKQAGLTRTDVGVAALKAGEGVVTAAQVQGRPAVAILGGDEAGLAAAATLFAGRLPHISDSKSPTLDAVGEEVRKFLADRDVSASSVSVRAAYVLSGSDDLDRLVAIAQVASAADQTKAAQALRALVQPRRPTPAAGAAPARATRAAAPAQSTAAGERPLSFPGVRSLRVDVAAAGTVGATVDVPGPPPPGPRPLPRRPGAGPKENLDLSNLYSIDGFLGDSDNNLIPDRIDVLLSASDPARGVVDLAARLGLESTGVSIPIARPAAAIAKPEDEPTLVLIGTSHPIVDQLVKEKTFDRPALQPGEGLIQVVRKAFGEKGAAIVTGGDARGLARALTQVAERFPHVWARGKDRTTLDDVEDDVRRFLGGRTPAGQAALALYKLDRLATDLAGRDLEQAHVRLFVEKPADGFADVVRREAAARIKAGDLQVTVEDLDVQRAKPVVVNGTPIGEEFDVPSEVDDFWRVFRGRALPGLKKLKKSQPVAVEARLSEPPGIRAQIEQSVRAELTRAGFTGEVKVLSAYKQGYSWLYDVVRPALAGKPVDKLVIRFAEIGPPPEWKHQAMYAPTRWLLELFPIDEVLARELKLDLTQIVFEKAPIGSPAYEVIATAGGRELLRQTFEPKVVVRPYFDRFPDYEKVRVTTGWVTARAGDATLVDERIVTDPEKFWDHFQSKTLPAIYDYVMDLHEGKPRAEDAPHFGELIVDLRLSEPDYQVGVDMEQIASMEAMHEEIYFGTLHFFDVLGRYARGPALDYPGRVIPIMRPASDGKAGHAKVAFTGFGASRPGVAIEYRERGGRADKKKLDVPPIAVERPSAMAAFVRDGRPGLERLTLRVKVDSEKDERAELVKRTREERVDATIISAEQVSACLANLATLRAAGLYRDALAYHDLGTLEVVAAWGHDPDPALQRTVSLEPNGSPAPFPDIRTLLPAGYRYTGGPIVQWDAPIPPPEAYELLAKMSAFPEATVYKVGESYLGKEVWAMDLMPPLQVSHWSQAKATTLKPTVIYSARQHANEVSSTSHVLKLAELLLTDPGFRTKLNTVNVVIHPITNADGAQLAYDLQKITPNHMLHAGYLGSLGVDMTNAQWETDAIYPESKIRAELWRTWLPDIFLNPHGYPSHEWVQLFSEYAGWVRNRVTEARDWWGMRGWFIPGFTYLDDPKYPRHKDAAFTIRSLITANINAAPQVRALNQRAYDRYRRYGFAWDQENFKMDLTDDVLIYTAIKGAKANPRSPDFMVRQPNVTVWFGGTEAPDETARGDWMKLVATAGLQWDKAVLQYLVDGRHEVERKAEPFFGGTSLSLSRARPPKPKKETTEHSIED